MAMTLEQAQQVGYTCLKALLRFAFMVANNLVAIPSYVLYLIMLQPLRMLDSKSFWYIEGVLFKWLLAMVASWGWWAGYTAFQAGSAAEESQSQPSRLILAPLLQFSWPDISMIV
nr:acyl-CoA:lysophosphatidylglycerol acyltransferase 1 isoform X2 [Columba livia]